MYLIANVFLQGAGWDNSWSGGGLLPAVSDAAASGGSLLLLLVRGSLLRGEI